MTSFQLNASKELRAALCGKVVQFDSIKKLLDVKEKELEENKQDLQKLETQKPIIEAELEVGVEAFILFYFFNFMQITDQIMLYRKIKKSII